MAKNRLIKIILDTNWYISAAINRRSRRILYRLLTDANLQIFYSSELLREFKEVISRPKFQKIISLNQAARFMNLVLPRLSEVIITTSVQISRDKDDDYLLAMAIETEQDYLITGDDDLLVLKQIGNTKIMKMSEFQKIIEIQKMKLEKEPKEIDFLIKSEPWTEKDLADFRKLMLDIKRKNKFNKVAAVKNSARKNQTRKVA